MKFEQKGIHWERAGIIVVYLQALAVNADLGYCLLQNCCPLILDFRPLRSDDLIFFFVKFHISANDLT